MSKKQSDKLIKMLKSVLTDKEFLKEIGMTADELAEVLPEPELQKLNQELLATVEQENGMSRFSTLKVADIMSETLEKLGETPEEGWAVYSYRYVLNRLFPELNPDLQVKPYARGRILYLKTLQLLFRY